MGTKKKREKLNYNGCRLLAIGVIKSAIRDEDYKFFCSDLFHLYAGVAYNCKSDYRSGEDVIKDIETIKSLKNYMSAKEHLKTKYNKVFSKRKKVLT